MKVSIKRLFQLSDDLQEILIGVKIFEPIYVESYPHKVVLSGIEHEVFELLPKSFYNITLSHAPSNCKNFSLLPEVLQTGLLCNYDPEKREVYVYNCTENTIYIKKDAWIGDFYD